MAAPDHDRFRERFTEDEFQANRVSDDALDLELASTYSIAGEYRPALSTRNLEMAAMYLAAHNLTAEQTGSSQSDRPGDSVSRSAGSAPMNPFDSTKYGRAFKVLVGSRVRGVPLGTEFATKFGIVA